MNWPEYYPDNCPPESSCDVNGKLFRLIPRPDESLKKLKKEFTPFAVRNPEKWGGNCQACGLSSYITLDECSRIKKTIPRLKKLLPAQAQLDSCHGKVLNTPSKISKEHYTWWVPADIEKPWELFESTESN